MNEPKDHWKNILYNVILIHPYLLYTMLYLYTNTSCIQCYTYTPIAPVNTIVHDPRVFQKMWTTEKKNVASPGNSVSFHFLAPAAPPPSTPASPVPVVFLGGSDGGLMAVSWVSSSCKWRFLAGNMIYRWYQEVTEVRIDIITCDAAASKGKNIAWINAQDLNTGQHRRPTASKPCFGFVLLVASWCHLSSTVFVCIRSSGLSSLLILCPPWIPTKKKSCLVASPPAWIHSHKFTLLFNRLELSVSSWGYPDFHHPFLIGFSSVNHPAIAWGSRIWIHLRKPAFSKVSPGHCWPTMMIFAKSTMTNDSQAKIDPGFIGRGGSPSTWLYPITITHHQIRPWPGTGVHPPIPSIIKLWI